jgi:protein-S-isoprenylcysteine O-methyltransferase Ste14
MELNITRSKARVRVSRLFAVLILALILFTGHSFAQEGVLDTALETGGVFLLTIAAVGRLWALLYISGHKKKKLVTTGPYSIMRHPLYVFSLIGALGIGVTSENLLVLAVILAFYALYYPFAIRAEEKKLIDKFGEAYTQYRAAVPAFVPKLSLYQGSGHYEVNTDTFLRNFGDAIWFIWMFPLLHCIEALQNWGVLPVLWRLP